MGSLTLLTKVATRLLCSALPNPEEPSDLEIQILNDSLSAVAQKHFDSLVEYDAEFALALALAGVIIPRLQKKKIPEAEKLAEPKNLFELKDKITEKKDDATKSGSDSRAIGERKDTNGAANSGAIPAETRS